MDSPAGSQEIPGGFRGAHHAAHAAAAASDHHHHHHVTAAAAASSPVMVVAPPDEDSDFETEPDPADWRPLLAPEQRDRVSKREAKRQDIINGEHDNFPPVSVLQHSTESAFVIF